MDDWRKPQASTKPTFPCPGEGCGKQLRKPYLYQHMREAHNLRGGETGIVRTLPRDKAVAADYHRPDEGTITVPVVKSTQSRFKVLDSMKVLVAEDGSLWIGEKIRD